MTPDMIDLLKQLAARFGVTVEYLWPLLVNYTRWTNVAWLVVCLAWIAVGTLVVSKAVPAFFKHTHLYNDRGHKDYVNYEIHGMYMFVALVATGLSAVAIVLALAAVPGFVGGVMVPEAKAIYDLMAQIKGK